MFIHIHRFYEKTEELRNTVSLLDFKPSRHGSEILNFNLISPGIDGAFSTLLNHKIILNKEMSGVFRKPNDKIHVEDFGPTTSWISLVALEDTIFKTWKHKETGATTIFEVANNPEKALEFVNNNADIANWDIVSCINLYSGDMVLIKPWLWHSLDNKLIKVFYLELPQEADKETINGN